MAKIALGEVPCLACKGGGPCARCGGDGKEPIPYELRARMHAELAAYVAPKRKAVEHGLQAGTAAAAGGGAVFIMELGDG